MQQPRKHTWLLVNAPDLAIFTQSSNELAAIRQIVDGEHLRRETLDATSTIWKSMNETQHQFGRRLGLMTYGCVALGEDLVRVLDRCGRCMAHKQEYYNSGKANGWGHVELLTKWHAMNTRLDGSFRFSGCQCGQSGVAYVVQSEHPRQLIYGVPLGSH
jgi:hypothetical protein